MEKRNFDKQVTKGIEEIISTGYKLEDIKEKKFFVERYGSLNAIFAYSSWCEKNFEANLREDYSRKTTFTADFSIAEWCQNIEPGAVLDTAKRCLKEWHTDIEYFAELIIALNMKSWEHHSRGNMNWSALYADLYYLAKDLFFDWFKNNKEAIDYYYDFVD